MQYNAEVGLFTRPSKIGPRLNIKYGFNPDGIKRKTNSIGQAGQAKRPFMDGHKL